MTTTDASASTDGYTEVRDEAELRELLGGSRTRAPPRRNAPRCTKWIGNGLPRRRSAWSPPLCGRHL